MASRALGTGSRNMVQRIKVECRSLLGEHGEADSEDSSQQKSYVTSVACGLAMAKEF